jgi:hypothetical protein
LASFVLIFLKNMVPLLTEGESGFGVDFPRGMRRATFPNSWGMPGRALPNLQAGTKKQP